MDGDWTTDSEATPTAAERPWVESPGPSLRASASRLTLNVDSPAIPLRESASRALLDATPPPILAPPVHIAASVTSSATEEKDASKPRGALERALQGVLYSMVRGNAQGAILAYIIMFSDVFQMLVFTFDADIPWNFPFFFSNPNTVALIFGLTPYYFVFGLSFVLIGLVYLNVIYVARGFLRGHFRMIWPLKTLRTVITTLVTIGYIPLLKLLIVPLNCKGGKWSEFPEVDCDDFLFALVLAVMGLVAFVPLCLLMALVYFDQNPLSSSMLARYTGRVEALFLSWKTILTLVFVLSHVQFVKPILLLLTTSSVILCTLRWLPYYNSRATKLSVAIQTFFLVFAAFGILISAINPAVGGSPYFTLIAFVVAVPSAVGAYFLTGRRMAGLKRRAESTIPALNTLESTSKPLAESTEVAPGVKLFSSSTYVPACARSFYALPLTADSITRMRHVHERGLAEFPNDPVVYMVMSQFLLQVTNDPGRALAYIRKAKTMSPAFDVRFSIYCLERDIQQNIETKNVGGSDNVDVVTFIQYQKSIAEAGRYHRETLKHLIDFWGRLDKGEPDYDNFPKIVHNIAVAEAGAESSYKMLLKHFPNSRSLVLSYARFLEFGKNDQEMAAHYYDLAEQLENGANVRESSVSESQDRPQSSGKDWASGTAIGEARSFKNQLSKRRLPAAVQVRNGFQIAVLVSVGCFIMFFALMQSQFVDRVTASEMMQRALEETASMHQAFVHIREMQFEIYYNESGFNDSRTYLGQLIDTMEADQRKLFQFMYLSTTNGNTTLDAYIAKPSVQVPYVANALWEPVRIGYEKRGASDAFEIMMGRFRGVQSMSIAQLADPALINDTDFRALLETKRMVGGPADVPYAFSYWIAERSYNEALQGLSFWVVTVFVGCMALFIVGQCRIVPAMQSVARERVRTIDVFLEIPGNVVHDVYKKLKTAHANEGTRETNAKRDEVDTAAKAEGQSMERLVARVRWQSLSIVAVVLLMGAVALIYIFQSRFDPYLYSLLGAVHDTATSMGFFVQEKRAVPEISVFTQEELNAIILALGVQLQNSLYALSVPSANGADAYTTRFPTADDLLNGNDGLMNVCNKFNVLASQIATDPTINPINDTRILDLMEMQESIIMPLIASIINDAVVVTGSAKTIFYGLITALFVLMMLIVIFVSAVAVPRLVSLLHNESRRTYGMLMMIPPNVAAEVPAINDFITQSHRWTQDTINPADAECTLGVTAEGVILSCERGRALGYSDDQELVGLMITSVVTSAFGTAKKGTRVIPDLEKRVKPFMQHRLSRVIIGANSEPMKFAVSVVEQDKGRIKYLVCFFKRRDYEAKSSPANEPTLGAFEARIKMKMTREVLAWGRDAMVLVDQTGVIRDINNAALRLLKRDARSLLTNPIGDFVPALRHDGLTTSIRLYGSSAPEVPSEHVRQVEVNMRGQKETLGVTFRPMGDKGCLLVFSPRKDD